MLDNGGEGGSTMYASLARDDGDRLLSLRGFSLLRDVTGSSEGLREVRADERRGISSSLVGLSLCE